MVKLICAVFVCSVLVFVLLCLVGLAVAYSEFKCDDEDECYAHRAFVERVRLESERGGADAKR